MSPTKVSIVILNWNGKAMMQQFLPSVVRHSRPAAQVVVADNGSTDGSLEMLRRDFPEVQLLPLDANYGFAEGYNRALARLDSEYLLLLNSDVEVTPGWLEPLVGFLDSHPDYAACQPKLLAQRDPHSFEYAGAAGGYLDRYGYPFCRGRLFDSVEQDNGQYDTPADVFWATGAALLIRRTDWLAAGGFDGRFFAHMEEIDFCWRLRARGRRIACVPASVARHVGGGTLSADNPRKTFLNFRNNLLMLYKNLPPRQLAAVMRVRTLLDYVAALKFLLVGHWGDFRAVWRARSEYRRLRPDFAASRQENMQKAQPQPIPEQYDASILVAYYLRGCKTFERLRWPQH